MIRPLGNGRVIRNEKVVYVSGYEPCCGFLFTDDVDDVLSVEIPLSTEELLFTVIMAVFVKFVVP